MKERWIQSLGWEDSLEKGIATHSSILAWRIPWTEEPGGLVSMGSQRVRHNWATNTFTSSVCFLLESFYSESESSSVVCDSLRPLGLYSPWNSPGQNIGVGSLSLLQAIFPTQGLNLGLLHCRRNLYQLSHKGSPRILEWVAYPFSSGSSQPRNWTRVSCTAGRFLPTELECLQIH